MGKQSLMFNEAAEKSAVYYRRGGQHHVEGKRIVDALLPKMPHSLSDGFQVEAFGAYGGVIIDGITIDFKSMSDLQDDAQHLAALGTINKVTTVLAANGWNLQSGPTPIALQYDVGRMDIRVRADKELSLPTGLQSGWWLFKRPVFAPHKVTLSLSFLRMPENERCRLVEKEVIVPATEAHTETKMVVVCDEVEGG